MTNALLMSFSKKESLGTGSDCNLIERIVTHKEEGRGGGGEEKKGEEGRRGRGDGRGGRGREGGGGERGGERLTFLAVALVCTGSKMPE